jgi:hypothetical protein
MRQAHLLSAVIILLILGASQSVFALNLGQDITVYDGNSQSNTSWFGTSEDQEVEPGTSTGQSWDLEGFFLNGTSLTMVGGYNFRNASQQYTSGDIFIDVDGDAAHQATLGGGNGYRITQNTYGYDYVIDLDFSSLLYSVYQLDDSTRTESVYFRQNDSSGPWRLADGGTLLSGYENLGMGYYSGLSDLEAGGLQGNYHNAVVVSLSFLPILEHSYDFTAHFTMGCGNDNLMGSAADPVPEPSTLLLFGSGMVLLGRYGRKYQNNKSRA